MELQTVDELVKSAAGSLQVSSINDQIILTEPELRHIAKGFRQLSAKVGDSGPRDNQKQLEATLQSVIRTAASIQLSESHAAAACDALRGCLAQCESSDDAEIRTFAYGKGTWLDIFDVILTTSERRKPKPLKLLLAALERNLAHNPFQTVRDDLIAHFSFRAWQSISAQEEINAVKPFLQALQLFLSKSLVQPSDILRAVSQGQLSLSKPQKAADHGRYDSLLPVSQRLDLSNMFLRKALAWIRYPDTARIASRLVSTFCCSVRTWSSTRRKFSISENFADCDEPLWLSAFNSFLQFYPDRFDLLATHVFPEILRQDQEGTQIHLQKLQSQSLQSIVGYSLVDLQINLLLLNRMVRISSFEFIDKQTVQTIGAGLLCHVSPQIRAAVFSLLINSCSSKEFFTATTLHSLRYALPSYHSEVNPKIRHENVAMIKNLISKIAISLKSVEGLPKEQLGSKRSAARGSSGSSTPIKSSFEGHDYRQQQDFLAWYLRFLICELSPTASYQRHVVSLQILEYILSQYPILLPQWMTETESRSYMHRDPCSDLYEELLISLLEMVMNPFDDVRELTTSILRNYSDSIWSMARFGPPGRTVEVGITETQKYRTGNASSYYKPIKTRALYRSKVSMQGTGRADHADGFGRLYALVYGPHCSSKGGFLWDQGVETAFEGLTSALERCVAIAEGRLHLAARAASLHGYLIATRHLVLQINRDGLRDPLDAVQLPLWRRLSHRLLEISTRVWQAVKFILCADAPEGHEADGLDGEVEINTKDLLSYCWRALKESSTLMYSMIAGDNPGPFLRAFQHVHYETFGELVLKQLAELRHRGAFSTVSQTFSECCLRCAQSDNSVTRALPMEWYQRTLAYIQHHASALTRRSAGIPAMITSILSAYPEGAFFDTVVRDLQEIADSAPIDKGNGASIELPQVHAFNCLKDIFTESKFGDAVEGHVSKSLEIAVQGLESDQWAIRNCGLMLLKALISRLNDGTNTRSSELSSSTRRLSSFVYEKYQNLPELVLRLLTAAAADERNGDPPEGIILDVQLLRAQHVFPALEIIERSGIPKQHDSEIWQAVWTHLEGPVWSIREKAAKALSYLPVGTNIRQEMERCLQSPWPSQNALHGRHLYLRFIVPRIDKEAAEPIQQIFTQILDHFQDMIALNCCPITRASYTALVTDILSAMTDRGTALGQSPIGGTDSCNSSTVGFPSNSVFSTIPWKEFTVYLRQNSPRKPESALENAARSRCKLLVDSLGNNSRQERSPTVDIRQSIFTDHGIRGIPRGPEHSDQVLLQTGRFLADWAGTVDENSFVFRESIECWARALRLAQDENANLSTRQAAVDSLAEYLLLTRKQSTEERLTPVALKLYVILYDFLLDDDEDVRNTAAAAASNSFISTVSKGGDDAEVSIPLMVPAARQKLLELLRHSYHNSKHLWKEAVQRLMNGRQPSYFPNQSLFPSPRALLHDLRKDDTALFVEEKQNLYVDEAQEADVWQEVLLSMNRSTINGTVLAELGKWAVEGLDALVEVAEQEEDGPLDWTSKPDVFTFGVRALLTVQALLRLSEDEGLSVGKAGLNARLARLEEVGAKSCLRPAWMRIIRESTGKCES